MVERPDFQVVGGDDLPDAAIAMLAELLLDAVEDESQNNSPECPGDRLTIALSSFGI